MSYGKRHGDSVTFHMNSFPKHSAMPFSGKKNLLRHICSCALYYFMVLFNYPTVGVLITLTPSLALHLVYNHAKTFLTLCIPGPMEVTVCPDQNVEGLVLVFPKVSHTYLKRNLLHFR